MLCDLLPSGREFCEAMQTVTVEAILFGLKIACVSEGV